MENKRDQSKNPAAPQKQPQPSQQPGKSDQKHQNNKAAPTQQKKPGSNW